MYLKWGSYVFDDNIVDLSHISAQRMHSPRHRLAFMRYTMHCEGHFCVSGQTNIRAKLDAFETALVDDWKDVALYHDDGTKSAHWLSNSRSINGVRVIQQTYPSVEAEYASGRSFTITFQADYFDIEDQIWDFEESLTFLGTTGPRWHFVETFAGNPHAVITSLRTTQKIIQQGMAIGIQAPPILPTPLFPPNMEHLDQRMTTRGSAQKIGRHDNALFPVRYRYVFESLFERPQVERYPRPDYPNRYTIDPEDSE